MIFGHYSEKDSQHPYGVSDNDTLLHEASDSLILLYEGGKVRGDLTSSSRPSIIVVRQGLALGGSDVQAGILDSERSSETCFGFGAYSHLLDKEQLASCHHRWQEYLRDSRGGLAAHQCLVAGDRAAQGRDAQSRAGQHDLNLPTLNLKFLTNVKSTRQEDTLPGVFHFTLSTVT